MKVSHLIVLILLNVGWAATMSINKALGSSLQPGAIVTLRFGLSAVCLAALWPLWRGPAPRGRDLGLSILIGLLVFVLGQRLQVLGNSLSTAGNCAVLMGVEPLLTSVAASMFLREHLGPRRIVGLAVSLAGVLLLNQVWRDDFQWVGLVPSLIFVSSFICETGYSILGKPILFRADPMKILSIALIGATVANLLIDGSKTVDAARSLRAPDWLLLTYMAIVCTVVGYGVWFMVIKEAPVNVVALTIFVQPVAGVALAAIWLHEPLHWGQMWGSFAIVAGLAYGLSRQIKVGTGKPGEVAD